LLLELLAVPELALEPVPVPVPVLEMVPELVWHNH